MDSDPFVVPDRVGDVLGWRCWGIVEHVQSGDVRLASINHAHLWTPRAHAIAACHVKPDLHTDDLPVIDCTCGIYAAKEPRQASSYIHRDRAALPDPANHYRHLATWLGLLQQWGKIEEGSAGRRSQFAYPKMVCVPTWELDIATRVVDTYGIRVETGDDIDLMYGLRDRPTGNVPPSVMVEVKRVVPERKPPHIQTQSYGYYVSRAMPIYTAPVNPSITKTPYT